MSWIAISIASCATPPPCGKSQIFPSAPGSLGPGGGAGYIKGCFPCRAPLFPFHRHARGRGSLRRAAHRLSLGPLRAKSPGRLALCPGTRNRALRRGCHGRRARENRYQRGGRGIAHGARWHRRSPRQPHRGIPRAARPVRPIWKICWRSKALAPPVSKPSKTIFAFSRPIDELVAGYRALLRLSIFAPSCAQDFHIFHDCAEAGKRV